MTFTSDAIYIGSFAIYYYGIILMLGVVGASFVANAEAQRRKQDQDFLWDSLVWMVVGGVVGARIWHVLTPPPSMVERGITFQYYLTHPLDAINLRAGGLGIPGAVIGGLLALYIYARRKNEKFITWVDIIAPGLALGQAIGRWGNFVNQELYGAPTDLPWAIFIDPVNRLPEYADIGYYHPIFLYEALWSLATMFLLLWLARRFAKKLIDGDIMLVYLMAYPIIRILLDFLRLDASEVGGINANQTFMIVVLLASALALYLRHRQVPAKAATK